MGLKGAPNQTRALAPLLFYATSLCHVQHDPIGLNSKAKTERCYSLLVSRDERSRFIDSLELLADERKYDELDTSNDHVEDEGGEE